MSRRIRYVPYPAEFKTRRLAGERICVWCGKELPSRARRWCGDDCVTDYQLARLDQGAARRYLQGRHHQQAAAANPTAPPWRAALSHPMPCELCGVDMSPNACERRAADPVLPNGPGRATTWEADHIVPIVEGGKGERANLRVLCRPCHVRVTAELRARLAARRKKLEGGV